MNPMSLSHARLSTGMLFGFGSDFQRIICAAKCLHAHAEFIHHTEVYALKWFALVRPVHAGLKLAIGVAGKHHGELHGGVFVAVGKGRAAAREA